jgi:hypothetical protein
VNINEMLRRLARRRLHGIDRTNVWALASAEMPIIPRFPPNGPRVIEVCRLGRVMGSLGDRHGNGNAEAGSHTPRRRLPLRRNAPHGLPRLRQDRGRGGLGRAAVEGRLVQRLNARFGRTRAVKGSPQDDCSNRGGDEWSRCRDVTRFS